MVFSPELELLFEELLLLLEALLLELLSVLSEAEEPCEGVLAELHATNDMDNKNNIVLKYSMLSTLNIFEDLDISIDVINEINNVENLLGIYKKNYKDSQVKNYQLKIDMNKEWEKNINSYFNFNIGNNDLVTVVVPVYNTSNKLIKCVESLMKQSYRNIEILLINDGSTDNSLVVCKYLSNIDDRIKVISQDNKGLSEV